MAHLKLSLLGGFEAALDRQPLDFRTQKIRALLAYLAIEADTSHSRDRLMGLLWPDSLQADARNNLRVSLTRLRRALGNTGHLLFVQDTLQFNPQSDYSLDVAAFLGQLEECKTHSHPALDRCVECHARLEQALHLYRGDLLASFFVEGDVSFEEWATVRREQLHQQAMWALEQLARYHEQRRAYVKASRDWRRQLELEPWREETHRQLMYVLALAGQRSAALQQYEICRRVLTAELRVEPNVETLALYEQIQRGEIGAPEQNQFPQVSGQLHNLQPTPTPFFGRTAELDKIEAKLLTPSNRLVTLLGEGGVGKTRLALAAAERLLPHFTDGVWFVPFGGVEPHAELLPAALVHAALKALGLPYDYRRDAQSQLFDYLRSRHLLLVLDNMEHLLAQAADWVADLILDAPLVRVIVTSRAPLNLQMEYRLRVEGLPIPSDPRRSDATAFSSVQLFVERAERMGAVVQDADLIDVARICQLVGGAPLGIELAASWMNRASPAEIAQKIQSDLNALTTTLRDLPTRHHSMRAVFEQSWRLLTPDEQRVFEQLSVFRGVFTRADVEGVTQRRGAAEILASLSDQSLIWRRANGLYEVHELLRQYAEEKLAQDAQAEAGTYARHSAYYSAFLFVRENALKGAGQLEAMQEIRRKRQNVLAAWQWAVKQGEDGLIAQALEGLYVFYDLEGELGEGDALLGAAVSQLKPNEHIPRALIVRLLNRQAHFNVRLTRNERVRALLQESEVLNTALPKPTDVAMYWFVAGARHIRFNEIDAARDALRRALADCEQRDDDWGAARVLLQLTLAATRIDDQEDARQWVNAAHARARRRGSPWELAQTLHMLGAVETAMENYDAAADYYRECLALRREIGDQLGLCTTMNNLGDVLYRRSEYTQARDWLRQSHSLAQQLNVISSIANTLCGLGMVAIALGDYEQAETAWLDLQRLVPTIDDRFMRDGSTLLEAQLLRMRGQLERAIKLITPFLQEPGTAAWLRVEAKQIRRQIETQSVVATHP